MERNKRQREFSPNMQQKNDDQSHNQNRYSEPKSATLVQQKGDSQKLVNPSTIVRTNSAPLNRSSLKTKISEIKITVKELKVKEASKVKEPIKISIKEEKIQISAITVPAIADSQSAHFNMQLSKIYESTQNLWNIILKIKEFELSGIKSLLKNVFISEPNIKNENEIYKETAQDNKSEIVPIENSVVFMPIEQMHIENTNDSEIIENLLESEHVCEKLDDKFQLLDKNQDYIIDFFPIDSNKSVYLLTVGFTNFIFRGRICVNSEFIDINDLIHILSGKDSVSECVNSEFKMEIINNSENLLVTVTIHFRLKVNLKPITQTLIYCLDRFEKDPILEHVHQLKKRIECIEEEQERVVKRFCLSQQVYHSFKKPLTLEFHFSVFSTQLEKSKRHSLVLGNSIHFLEYLEKNDRFQDVKAFFQHNSFSFDLLEAEKHTNMIETNEFRNRHILKTAEKELLVSWDSLSNFYLTHDSLFKMQNYIQKTQKSKLVLDLEKINMILVTMFEINIEYELKGKLLLKPSIFGEKLEYIEMEGISHKFNILQYIQNPPVLKDQVYFNPALGFYKSFHC
jgi:hypothetical protein